MLVNLVSLGCDKNLADSQVMLGLLNERGFSLTAEENKADVIVVNTCGFIAEAVEEGIETILRLAENKKNGSCKALIVTGCMAARYKDEIFGELPEVDAVIGTGDFESIESVVKDLTEGKNKIKLFSGRNNLYEDNSMKRVLTVPCHFAYLKIAEGCDNRCTYCTIPDIKGGYKSRPMESIISEAKMLAGQGVRELILVAQDTALYGTDIYGKNSLHLLLGELSRINEIKWIRILYCYPEHITDESINEMASNEKICHYIDMPIQHSNDKVLNLMGRSGTSRDLKNVINKLRSAMPDISIRTTLITGFPGEGEKEFSELLEFVKEIEFDRLGVFAYSCEEGTPAFHMENQLEQDVKEFRRDKLMTTQKEISRKKCAKAVGKKLLAIVDGYLPEDSMYCGRSYMDCYETDGIIFIKSEEPLAAGDFIHVMITSASDYDLIGEICDEPSE